MIPIYETIDEVRKHVVRARSTGKTIGLVPTMGALHEGHASLIRTARLESDDVIISIFVNPIQFGPNEDLAKYPRTLAADQELCTLAGASAIFHPQPRTVYPADFSTHVEVEQLDSTLCGPRRPGHFRGVCTVVLKLFNIVQPDCAIFGAKDYQQAAIITRMVRDLDLPVRMVIAPTIRESDGLAMSSRNRYLTPEQRQLAPRIYLALRRIQERVSAGVRKVSQLEAELNQDLAAIPGSRTDYALIVDAENLQPVDEILKPAVAAVAVFLGSTRLIDNIVLQK